MPLRGLSGVKKAIDKLPFTVNDRARAVVLQGFSNIMKNAAVDEGRFRNNFFVTVGSPSDGERERKDKQATDSLRSLNTNLPEFIIGTKVFVTNNLPYAEFLEYQSKQHKGQIRIELKRIQRALRNL